MIKLPTTRLNLHAAVPTVCLSLLVVACSSQPTLDRAATQSSGESTIADLSGSLNQATKQAQEGGGREKAIAAYRRFLEQYPQSPRRDVIARRLADLLVESAADLQAVQPATSPSAALPGADAVRKRYEDAITIYTQLLAKHPTDQSTPELLYQLSRAYEETGQTELAIATIDRLLAREPQRHQRLYADAQFRRGELLFADGAYQEAAKAFRAVVELGETVPNYEQALYKLGWSYFKEERYDAALATFFSLLDRKLTADTNPASQLKTLSRAEQEQLADVFRAVSMSFSYQAGVQSVARYFRRHGRRSYEDQVYLGLADFYVAHDQVSEAAETWLALAQGAPLSPEAPRLYIRAIEQYRRAGFRQRVVEAETAFARRYGMHSEFWKQHTPQAYADVLEELQSSLIDLAQYYHARAQEEDRAADYREAEQWYRAYLDGFADAERAGEMNFRLAELLYEQGEYRKAIEEYERTARFRGDHSHKADAGKAVLHAYAEYLKRTGSARRGELAERATASAVRFAFAYPDDPESPAILAQTGADLLERKAYREAVRVSKQFLEHEPTISPALRQTAWSLLAQAEYGEGDYQAAEYAYNRATQLTREDDPRRSALNKGRAAAIYKQAEQRQAQGDRSQAAALYLRAADTAADSSIQPKAQYDAATSLLAIEAWQDAIRTLEQFRADHPRHPLQEKATQKLAYAYDRSDRKLSAAAEYLKLGKGQLEAGVRREALMRAAELYHQAGQHQEAIQTLELYLAGFPKPADAAVDVMQQLADLELAAGNAVRRRDWLDKIVKLDRKAGNARTRVVAAQATLELAEDRLLAFRSIRLVKPLKKSLAGKLREMKRALKVYEAAIGYGVAPVTSAAKYNIARMYDELSQELRASERPADLHAEALAQYELLLEEQAAPFEQQAIQIYASNVRQAGGQAIDRWVEMSRQRLNVLRSERINGMGSKADPVDAR
jgi:tetratricopeptide (TPR) repeat protein